MPARDDLVELGQAAQGRWVVGEQHGGRHGDHPQRTGASPDPATAPDPARPPDPA